MAFQQALSGLNAASKAIDATSHNIANSSTVGFKSSSAHFGDVYAASLNGAGASQIGIGVNLAAVQQQFTQGNLTASNNPLDIAINGAGFFRMDSNGAVTYARNGQFHLDKNGYIINDQNAKLTGYNAKLGIVVPSSPLPLQISASDIPPVETGTSTTAGFNGVKANFQLDSRETPPDLGWTAGAIPPNPNSYNYSQPVSIYDSLGNAHTLTMYFVKTANPGEWNVHYNVDGTSDAHVNGGTPSTVNFGTDGKLVTPYVPTNIVIDLNGVVDDATGIPGSNNAHSYIGDPTTGFKLDFTGTTQFGSAFGNNRLEQDGYSSGHLIGLSVGDDGIIQGRYSNGQTFLQGQIVLANFTNPNGLSAQGNNQWVETSVSGSPMVGAPLSSNLGSLSSANVEESNVDLTAELVNLITQQRNYQANSQAIKTQDQIMQTLVNLR